MSQYLTFSSVVRFCSITFLILAGSEKQIFIRLTTTKCLQINVYGPWTGVLFISKWVTWASNIFSCLSSYSAMLNIISTPFSVTLFYFYLNKATWVNFSSLLQISNSNILFISSFIRHFGFILYAAIIVCTCQ